MTSKHLQRLDQSCESCRIAGAAIGLSVSSALVPCCNCESQITDARLFHRIAGPEIVVERYLVVRRDGRDDSVRNM